MLHIKEPMGSSITGITTTDMYFKTTVLSFLLLIVMLDSGEHLASSVVGMLSTVHSGYGGDVMEVDGLTVQPPCCIV